MESEQMTGIISSTDAPSGGGGTTFNLPLSSNVLFLTFKNISGPKMSGSVDIVTSPDQPHDVATILVFVRCTPENTHEGCKASVVHRGEGEIGVSDWVRQQQADAKFSFEMKAILPEPSDGGSPLVIKRFETDVANATQKVGDLKDKVIFQSLSLKTTNGAIHVESLKVHQGRIETESNGPIHGQFHNSGKLILSTSNGAIHGQFHASGELILSTSNGKIETNVELTSIEGSKAKVSMDTSNGIKSNISLCSSSGSGGSFKASTTTTNGHVDVKFLTSPLDFKLAFVGKNKNGDAYEGTVNLNSGRSIPTVDEHQREDPSGKNRKRVLVSTHAEKHSLSGKIYWEEAWAQPKMEGTVDAQTENGEVVLTL